ncbi:flagellar basal-body rod protein FlgG [Candidatus Gastranaerophilus sp. (ex Termes propinquus)]|nr:flagellar basal-body rod protein FlgG [Candidatus Gastranaerophilus sp. (ex Termes propinquus)]
MGYNLQGIVRRTTLNALNQFEKTGVVTERLSNMNTPGYKAVRFEEVMHEQGYATSVIRTDHSQGSHQVTDNPLDVSIKGPGFIPVTNKSGEIHYTRAGSFTVNKEGMIVTNAGDVVGSGIVIDADYEKLEIKPDGRVLTYRTLLSEPEERGVIPLVNFVNPEGLKEIGNNKFAKTEESGDALLVLEHSRMAQRHTERANVDVFASVNEIMRTNASLLASTTLLGAIDKMYEKAINIRQ